MTRTNPGCPPIHPARSENAVDLRHFEQKVPFLLRIPRNSCVSGDGARERDGRSAGGRIRDHAANARRRAATRGRSRRERMGRLLRRVLSRCHFSRRKHHRRPSIYDVRCRTPLAVYPETGRAARDASCSTLLRARFTQPTRSHGPLVVSYTTVSPLPSEPKPGWRSAFCCTFSRVTPGGCYPPPCSVEPGRSSVRLSSKHNATVLPTHSPASLAR